MACSCNNNPVSVSSSCGCSGSNTSVRQGSLMSRNNKNIKFYKDSITVTDGLNQLANVSVGDLTFGYEQFFTTNMLLPAETLDKEIQYGFLGDHITFAMIKITYQSKKSPCNRTGISCSDILAETSLENLNYNDDGFVDGEEPFIEYSFKTNPEEKRYISNMMVITGTDTRRVPIMILSNRNKDYDAKIEMLVSTNSVVIGDVSHTQLSDSLNTIDNLLYTNIRSDSQGLSINDDVNTLIYVIWDNISNIEINGKIITIDDNAIGKTNLIFKDDFNACQAHSLFNWALGNPSINIITGNNGADTSPPVITYSNEFDTEILLADYPINGTNGSDGYLITKTDLLDKMIDSISDVRDGIIYPDETNIKLTILDGVIDVDAINVVGRYQMVLEFSDVACNSVLDSFVLNIKDEEPPIMILSDLGYNICLENISDGTSGTSGTSGLIPQSEIIYVDDFNTKTITKQDLIDMMIATVYDVRDGDILKHINNIDVEISISGTNISVEYISAQPKIIHVPTPIDITSIHCGSVPPTPISPIEIPFVEGYYDIRFTVVDSDGNITSNLWQNFETNLNKEVLTLYVSQNKSPEIIFIDINALFLGDFSTNTISKNDLIMMFIESINDDRDGLITITDMNISIYKLFECANGVCVPGGTNGNGFEPIDTVELIYIDDQGGYSMRVLVTDSDGATTIDDYLFSVYL